MKIIQEKRSDSFIDVFPSLSNGGKLKLKLVLDELESIPHSFCGSAWLNSHHFLYASPQVESMLGYSRDLFFENGLMFIHSITPSQYIKPIYSKAGEYIDRMEKSGVGLRYPKTHLVEGALRKENEQIMQIRHQCCFIDCNGDDLASGPFLAVGIWHDITNQPEEVLEDNTKKADELLMRIRETFWDLYPSRFATAQSFFVKNNVQQIIMTPKEKQILVLLSSGHTTKQISSRLDISFHTVESHRKHLIKKFDAKNSVELLAKVNAICNSEVNSRD